MADSPAVAAAQTPRRGIRSLLRANVVVGAALVAVFFAVKFLVAEDLLRGVLRWVGSLGPLGPAIFVILYTIAPVLFIPGAILSIGAGTVFGLLAGSIYVSIGATLGATCAFLVGRYLARGWVAGKLEGNPKFKAIDRAVAREGWKIVGLARLSPFFPFNVLNYAFGLTEIPLKDYFFATWAGMIPGIIMYVYIGTLAGDVARIGTRPVVRTPGQWTLEVVGFIASVAVALYVTYVAGRALREKTAA